ncbi:MAG: Rnf-Nqr domain containing protein [Halanaerobiales bacterium]
MNEIGVIFWNYVLRNNMVFILSFGLLLVIVETPRLSESYVKGLKITAGMAVTSLTGLFITANISSHVIFLLPGIYFITSLVGIYVINKSGALRGQWIEGIPRNIMVLVPLLGLQLFMQEQTVLNYLEKFFAVLGSIVGFYLVFIIMAAVKEQLELNETEKIFKSEYILLIVSGFFAAILVGFNFM